MTRKHKQSDRLFWNKIIVVGIALAIIGLIVFISIQTRTSPMQRKLTGLWNIEFENSYIVRANVYEFSWTPMRLEDDYTIVLPQMHEGLGIDFQGRSILEDEKLLAKYRKRSDEIRQNSVGAWEIISTNPDSVFFNVPKHPLHGRYAVRFFIDIDGWVSVGRTNNIYKMELSNDSTLLICNKAGIMHPNSVRDWEGRN